MKEIILTENKELLEFFDLIFCFLKKNNLKSLGDPVDYKNNIVKNIENSTIINCDFSFNIDTSFCKDISAYNFTFNKSTTEKEEFVYYFEFLENNDFNNIEISLTNKLELRFIWIQFCNLKLPLYIVNKLNNEEELKIKNFVTKVDFVNFLEKNKTDGIPQYKNIIVD